MVAVDKLMIAITIVVAFFVGVVIFSGATDSDTSSVPTITNPDNDYLSFNANIVFRQPSMIICDTVNRYALFVYDWHEKKGFSDGSYGYGYAVSITASEDFYLENCVKDVPYGE